MNECTVAQLCTHRVYKHTRMHRTTQQSAMHTDRRSLNAKVSVTHSYHTSRSDA